ncbi:hypothetical protein TrLO_g7162 [Triparma laevis f. longispina]|uniref:Protein kinase domain-containing protein n=1 Tax=Triparma laevis f. longispina TaxID=1714387 RepID=A0A9W7KXA3_9STRA|nr:hypothetical protein TrLO_g7162 [Triparma laevis f. longispina]
MVVEPNPYTLSLGGTSKDSEHLYFIMSPILAGPIHKHFRAEGNGRFAYTRARFYCMNVTSALLFMHGKGFVHRDVKASNVLLNENGYAVLADFGYAKNILLNEDGSIGDPKPTFTFCGTLHCMAPEVLSKKETGHGFKADWWSLGIFVYEMMTGRPPWGYGVGEVERAQLERDIMDGEVRFEEGIFEGVGRSGRSFIEKLLVREEERRMGSLEEFKGETFFETGEWGVGGEGGGQYIEIGGEPPEFNKEIGDLDVLEDSSGESGGADFGSAFEGF